MKRTPRILNALNIQCEANGLADRGEHQKARELLEKLRLEQPEIRSSGQVAWCLAIACDNLKDYEAAYAYMNEALSQDPVSVPFHRSSDIIVDHIRGALSSDERKPDDASTPRMYELLIRSGEADGSSHLAMARHFTHAGNHAAARQLLDALTTLDPTDRPAWLLLAEVACATGDDTAAAEAATQAAALDGPLPPLGLAGEARS